MVMPVTMSADGRNNSFSLYCTHVGHWKPYAACLRIVEASKAGADLTLYPQCNTAICGRNCQAVGMRDEEMLKGEAIYFKERGNHAAGVGGAATPSKAPDRKSQSPAKSKSSLIDSIGAYDYASAITDAVNSESSDDGESKRAESPELPEPKIDLASCAKPGESLLEMARRLKGIAA